MGPVLIVSSIVWVFGSRTCSYFKQNSLLNLWDIACQLRWQTHTYSSSWSQTWDLGGNRFFTPCHTFSWCGCLLTNRNGLCLYSGEDDDNDKDERTDPRRVSIAFTGISHLSYIYASRLMRSQHAIRTRSRWMGSPSDVRRIQSERMQICKLDYRVDYSKTIMFKVEEISPPTEAGFTAL